MNVAVYAVKALGYVAGYLKMLLLILADGHIVCLIEQNVRRHEHGVGEESDVDIVRVLLGFVLELGHSRRLAELGVAVEYPRQLGVGADMALNKHDALLRVEPYREQERKGLHGLTSERRGVLPYGYGVQVCHGIDAVIVLAHRFPVAQSAEIVAESRNGGRLYCAENALTAFGSLIFHYLFSSHFFKNSAEDFHAFYYLVVGRR